jgi:hypothetical protein
MDLDLCPNASPCIAELHYYEWWAAFTFQDGAQLGMWVSNSFGTNALKSASLGTTPPPNARPVSGSFTLSCGTIDDATCTGAAAGSTDLSPNKPPQTVSVEPLAGSDSHYSVSLTFDDGSTATIEVAPDRQRDIGWSSVVEPAPTPTELACGFDGMSPITFIDHSGLIDSCNIVLSTLPSDPAELQPEPTESPTSDGVTVTRAIVGDERHLIVTWPSHLCSYNPVDLEFWGPLEHPLRPHYVLQVGRLPSTGGCSERGGHPFAHGIDLVLNGDVSADDVEAFVTDLDSAGSSQSTVSAQAASGRFVLLFGGRIGNWAAGEPIHISASVLYMEGRDKVTMVGQVVPAFGLEQLDGSLEIPPPPTILMCPADHPVVFERNVAQDTEYHLLQGAGSEQYSAYFNEYGYDDQFRLPAGTYRLYALLDFFVGDNCQGEQVTLQASTVITVR